MPTEIFTDEMIPCLGFTSVLFVAFVLKKLNVNTIFFLQYKSYYSPVTPYLSCV